MRPKSKCILSFSLLIVISGCANIGKVCIGIGPSCVIARVIEANKRMAASEERKKKQKELKEATCADYFDCSQMPKPQGKERKCATNTMNGEVFCIDI